jgi:chromosome segregation ATPase
MSAHDFGVPKRTPFEEVDRYISELRAELHNAQSAMSTWRQCAEARAQQLVAARNELRYARDEIADLSATIADLRAMLAAQQAVLDSIERLRDDPHGVMFEVERQQSASAFPSRALRGGDGVFRGCPTPG